jgi:exosortase K
VKIGLVALATALGLKLAYAHATAVDLRWVLGPSCFVAEQLAGLRFGWDPAAGYVSHGAHMVVGPPCAGVNFLVACSLALHFSCQARFVGAWRKLSLCAASFGAGYIATIAANGTRIALAVRLGHADFHAGVGSYAAVHRLIGVLVYAAALLVVCLAASRLLAAPRTGAARRIAIPVACYLGIALAVPLCHRALGHGAPGLAGHATQTSIALAVVAALALLGERLLDRILSKRADIAARS